MSAGDDGPSKARRRTSKRKMPRPVYEEDARLESGRAFDILEIVKAQRFPNHHCKEMASSDMTLDYIRNDGLRTPLLFHENTHLGMTLPPPTFTVNDVKTLVGASRTVDVMDCETQEGLQMTMAQWANYYNSPTKKTLLNVISLEFSHSQLDRRVESPSVVRQIDWVETMWPAHLRNKQRAATNTMDKMKYPKVRKYCLMSVGGCYTDFHVDFGGSSVWYHVLRGGKVFFLIPPTEKNLGRFRKWSSGVHQADVFFADQVDGDCSMVTLKAGDTFFIPSGWIHGVYTPVDSLVFGGNFLHSFDISGQLRVASLERQLRVPLRYRFPFFDELAWYVAASFEKRMRMLMAPNPSAAQEGDGSGHRHDLTPFELRGLRELEANLRVWLASPQHHKHVPAEIKDANLLVVRFSQHLARLRDDGSVAANIHNVAADDGCNGVEAERPVLASPVSETPASPKQKSKTSSPHMPLDVSTTATTAAALATPTGTTTSPSKSKPRHHDQQQQQQHQNQTQVNRHVAQLLAAPLTPESEAGLYATLRTVREALRARYPLASQHFIRETGKSEWRALSTECKNVFREMFSNSQQLSSGLTGELPVGVSALVAASTSDRGSKYERPGYRAPKNMVQRASSLERIIFGDSNNEDSEGADDVDASSTSDTSTQNDSSKGPSREQRFQAPSLSQTISKLGSIKRKAPRDGDGDGGSGGSLFEQPPPGSAAGAGNRKRISAEQSRGDDDNPSRHRTLGGPPNNGPPQAGRHRRHDSRGVPPSVPIRSGTAGEFSKRHRGHGEQQHFSGSHRQRSSSNNSNNSNQLGYHLGHENAKLPSSRGYACPPAGFQQRTPQQPRVAVCPDGHVTGGHRQFEVVVGHGQAGSAAHMRHNWLSLPKSAWNNILACLSPRDLAVCMQVCRSFKRWAEQPQLWSHVRVSDGWRITPAAAWRIGSLRPRHVNLSWCRLTQAQLEGLLHHCQDLVSLDLTGCVGLPDVTLIFSGLSLSLQRLNLGFLDGVNDWTLARFGNWRLELRYLGLAGTGVTDNGLYRLMQSTPKLCSLDLYQCPAITSAAFFGVGRRTCLQLGHVDLRFTSVCSQVLVELLACASLQEADVRDCERVDARSRGQFLVDSLRLGRAFADDQAGRLVRTQ